MRTNKLVDYSIYLILASAGLFLIFKQLKYSSNFFRFIDLLIVLLIFLNYRKYQIKKLPISVIVYGIYFLLRIIVTILTNWNVLKIGYDDLFQYNYISDAIVMNFLVVDVYINAKSIKNKTIYLGVIIFIISLIFFPYFLDYDYERTLNLSYVWSDLKVRLIISNFIFLTLVMMFFRHTSKYMYNMGFFIQSLIILLAIAHISETISHFNSIVASNTVKSINNQLFTDTRAAINIAINILICVLFIYRLNYRELNEKFKKLSQILINYTNYVFLIFFVLTIPFTFAENLFVLANGLIVVLFSLTVVITYLNHKQLLFNRIEFEEKQRRENEKKLSSLYK